LNYPFSRFYFITIFEYINFNLLFEFFQGKVKNKKKSGKSDQEKKDEKKG